MSLVKDILSTYLHFQGIGRVNPIPLSESFWEEVAAGNHPELEQGRLMSAFTFSEPWAMWERHPAGEELVMLLSGVATLILEESGQEQTIQLSSPGSYVVVPKNVWHTARADAPVTMLFLTPGAGTEHRPVGT
ncbi:cupin domain-containing protein [Piscinibacter sp.]|uniref:cupin domain-containing protein n=1 Tax=Piscinibacter sp. TaxID=1903157 RepID=UPI0039E28792